MSRKPASDPTDDLMRLIYGKDVDVAEQREKPEIFRARMEGRREANQRWNQWLMREYGYTSMQAAAIIGMEYDR